MLTQLAKYQAHMTTWRRFVLGVFVFAWLNVAAQPCAMAMELSPGKEINAELSGSADHSQHTITMLAARTMRIAAIARRVVVNTASIVRQAQLRAVKSFRFLIPKVGRRNSSSKTCLISVVVSNAGQQLFVPAAARCVRCRRPT